MTLYKYSCSDKDSKKIKGTIEADSLEAVVKDLRSKDLTILDISEAKTKIKVKGGSVDSKSLELFSRQLSSLIAARIPIVKSLEILASQTERKYFKEVILNIQKSIESGNTLCESFSKYPKIFSSLFVNMINVGEFSGNLDVMLDRLSFYIESYNNLIKKVKSALMYPVAVMIVAVIIVGVIFTWVIPGFKTIYTNLGGTLPIATQILIGISNFIRGYFILIFIIAAGSFFGLRSFLSTSRGIEISEKVKLKAPIFGNLYRKIVIARFTKTLAILIKSGVSILIALDIAGKTSGSKSMEKIIDSVKVDVSRGKKLAATIKEFDFFPAITTNMIGIGEEGGELGQMLEKVSDLYEKDVDNAISGFLSLLEPFIIVFMGVVIGGIVICLFLPIFKLHSLVK